MMRPSPVLRLLALVVLVLFLAGTYTQPAAANPREDKAKVDERVKSLKEEFEDLTDEQARTIAERDEAEAAMPAAEEALSDAQDDLAEAQAKDEELGARLTSAENAQQDLQAKMGEDQEKIDESKASVTQVARRAYQNSGVTSDMALLLQMADGQNGAAGMTRVDSAVRAQQRTIGELDELRANNRSNESRLSAISDEIEGLKADAAEAVVQKTAAENLAREKETALSDLIDLKDKRSQEIEDSKEATSEQLEKEEAQADKLAKEIEDLQKKEEAAARERGETYVPPGDGVFSNPAEGYPRTSPFGYRIHPITGVRKLHTGSDWGVPCGTPIRAAADGTVVSSGAAGGYGNRVVISHGKIDGARVATTYNHNTSLKVRQGQKVKAGQVISNSGTTGASTGCHLHFEVLRDGTYVDPQPYFG